VLFLDHFSKMNIEHISTADLIPYARNAKKHDASQVAKLAGSIREFGFNNPVLIDSDNGIIAGHGRVMAAQQLNLTEVPCIRLSHLTDNQRKAYILADNRLAEVNSGWDEEMLKLEIATIDWGDIKGLSVDDLEFGEIDFKKDEAETSDADAEPQIDKAEELRAKWGVEPGQLWELGGHRILCGDSTIPEHVAKLMGNDKAEMVFSDPPYALFGNSTGVHGIADDKMVRPFFRDIGRASVEWVENFGHVYLCCDWHTAFVIQSVITEVGLTAKNLCVWDKGDGGIGSNYQQCYELIWFFTNSPRAKGTLAKKEAGEKTVNGVPNIWRFPRVQSNRIHNAEKPVGMVSVPITNGSKPGNIVLDFFSGSGTVLIACEQLGRKCRAIEISPAYVAVAIQRWVDATGKEPKRLA
jgi:DNA modification methylase